VAGDLPRRAEISDANLKRYIANHQVEVDQPPTYITLAHDPTCNLTCQQCRSGLKIASGRESRYFKNFAERFVMPMLEANPETPRTVMISGNGDPFVSKHYRHILSLFDPTRHGHIGIEILTHGLYLKQWWPRFPGIHPLVKSITVSVDAASETTYRLLRGADWGLLRENLDFIAELRAIGAIEEFSLKFAVQYANSHEMGAFASLGEDLGVDAINFNHLRNHGTYSEADYAHRAVFDPGNAHYDDFLFALRHPALRSAKVNMGSMQKHLERALITRESGRRVIGDTASALPPSVAGPS
jgi:MoaA/NifB/PqqE/SkfB family radical SAM enzyme